MALIQALHDLDEPQAWLVETLQSTGEGVTAHDDEKKDLGGHESWKR